MPELATDAVLRPARNGNAFEDALERRLQAVKLGVLRQGDRLPPSRDLAARLAVSRVTLREEAKVVTVPGDAVQWEGCCHVVFVRDKDYLKPGSPKVFHVRKVRTGAKDERVTEVIAGLLPGELVVTRGSGLLLTELLRGDLGEGCACHSKK